MKVIPFKISRQFLNEVFNLPEHATFVSAAVNESGSFDFQIAVEGNFEIPNYGLRFEKAEDLGNAIRKPQKYALKSQAYLCVQHGGSPSCEKQNKENGLKCPKCK